MVVHAPVLIQPLQHQFNSVDVPVAEILVSPEEVLQEGDVLAQAGALPEGGRGFGVILALGIPQLRLQRIDEILSAHEIRKASAQVGTEIDELMLGI